MEDILDVRSHNVFKDFEFSNPLSDAHNTINPYELRDLLLVASTLLATLLIEHLFCSKPKPKNDVGLINQAFKELHTKDAALTRSIQKRQNFTKNLKSVQQFLVLVGVVLAFWCYKSPGFYHYLAEESPVPSWALLSLWILIMYACHYLR